MAARRRTARRRSRRPPADAAFLNVPYDAEYEELFLALLAGLSGFALIPRATLEIPGSRRRLDRIIQLIRQCRYSFHDLSRVELDPTPPATPRFNMPFELGLAVALGQAQRGRHEWLVFETRPHRVWKSLSDLSGTDEYCTARRLGECVICATSRSCFRSAFIPSWRSRNLRSLPSAQRRTSFAPGGSVARSAIRSIQTGGQPSVRQRGGVHPSEGRLTLVDWMARLAAHDDNHLDQLRRAIDGRA